MHCVENSVRTAVSLFITKWATEDGVESCKFWSWMHYSKSPTPEGPFPWGWRKKQERFQVWLETMTFKRDYTKLVPPSASSFKSLEEPSKALTVLGGKPMLYTSVERCKSTNALFSFTRLGLFCMVILSTFAPSSSIGRSLARFFMHATAPLLNSPWRIS